MIRRRQFIAGLGSTAAWPVVAWGQQGESDPFVGQWLLNLEKSRYKPGPPPRSASLSVQGEGQNRKATLAGIDAAGNSFTQVYMFIHDSQPHPVTGNPLGDAAVYTPVDENTVGWSVTKDGQIVQTGRDTVSRDGRTFTITSIRSAASGRPIGNVAVFDKQ